MGKSFPKLQLLWDVSRQQWSVSIHRGPRKEQRSMSRAKAHPCMWGSRADLSGLTQQSSYCSLECYFEEVHTGSGRKVSGDTAHNNLLFMRQNKGSIEGFWPGLPDPRNLRNILHFNWLCEKQQDKSHMLGKSLTEEEINQIWEEKKHFFQHVAVELHYRFLKLFHISGQQKPWTMQAVPPFT